MQTKKPIIILSGPVGAGKSTVAKALAALSPGPTAYIEGDTFWTFIAKGSPQLTRAKVFKMVMTSMTAAAVPYTLYGYEVILDFSLPPWFLDTACAIAKVREVPIDYVVLRPTEAVCAGRAAARAEGTIDNYAPYSELYASFDEAKKYMIEDDTSDAEAIARKIMEGLGAGRFRLG